ncbi:TRAP transporter small permease [Tateyamaria pelophila]|uniref:TRAP transporter small permease n=1 Tax=Tateyamaria pelophila TaxID=328415 RepID=UPI001CBBC5B6|nr:TRAP transporter small permease [Tateyamaria pelophila]
MLTRSLNAVYKAAGALAGFFLVAICVIVMAQIVARQLGTIIPSADEYAGFCLAATSFLGLAYSFRSGSHIRVTLFIQALGNTSSRLMLILALVVATSVSGLLAYHTILMVMQNATRGEVTSGLIPIPLWLPQMGMAIGITLFCVAIVEDLVNAILGRATVFNENETKQSEADTRKDGLTDL